MNELLFTPSKQPFLKGKTVLITGSSRGIGRAIAIRVARDGANVAIVAKTTEDNPKVIVIVGEKSIKMYKLPGTIHSVAEEVRSAGGFALAIVCDIRDDRQVQDAIAKTVERY